MTRFVSPVLTYKVWQTFKLGDLTLNTELYTQVEVTFEDGSVMLIPDGDERFKALDNANNEIQGVISLNEVSNKPNIMVLSSDVKERL